MIIKWTSVTINGIDKTGLVEDVDNGQLMIDLGYAEPVFVINPRHIDYPDPVENKPKKKR